MGEVDLVSLISKSNEFFAYHRFFGGRRCFGNCILKFEPDPVSALWEFFFFSRFFWQTDNGGVESISRLLLMSEGLLTTDQLSAGIVVCSPGTVDTAWPVS